MSKIICDVCGTRYPESAEFCPICGCARSSGGKTVADDILVDDTQPAAPGTYVKGGRFSKSNVRKRNQDNVYYEAESEAPRVKTGPITQEGVDGEYGAPEIAQKRKSNVILNVLLVIVIVALLCVSSYIFVEYFLPGIVAQTIPETSAPTAEATEAPTEPEITEEPTIPCTDLVWVDDESNMVILEAEGNRWLLNFEVVPADTTDYVEYYSSDESVVTVDSEGCLTAVGEGQAIVTIVCGNVELECDVLCEFVEETLPEETEEGAETDITEDTGLEETETAEETEASEEEAPEATEAPEETAPAGPTEPLKDVTLKANYEEITLTAYGQQYTFKLDGLSNEEATWASENEKIVTVDEKGTVTRVGKGKAYITVTYGEQQIKILIRCK